MALRKAGYVSSLTTARSCEWWQQAGTKRGVLTRGVHVASVCRHDSRQGLSWHPASTAMPCFMFDRPRTASPRLSAWLCRAEDEVPSSRGAAGCDGQASGNGAGGTAHPTQRELDQLREFVLTQQWLRQQALGDGTRGGAAAAPGNAAAAGAAHQLQAMQQLWEQGG